MIYKIKPILKQRLWGGDLLPKIYSQKCNDKIGEAWILSCLGENNSLLDNGLTLQDLFKQNPEIVAKGYYGEFPILIKLIDAQDDLSIQVHPSIKTEFWHILNSKPSKLYLGFKQDTNKQQVKDLLEKGQITSLLNNIDVVDNDSYLIKPGTIHSIGKNTFLLEVQQSADITYRLFDFNRVDKNGKKRELHINQALDCISYQKLALQKHGDNNHLAKCPFFNVYKHKINDMISLNANENSFHALIILDGHGKIKSIDKTVDFKQFDTFFIPASTGKYEVIGNVTFALVTL